MANEQVGTYEANTHLSEYLNRVHYRGERIVIERHGKPVAALVSVEDLARLESSSESVEERYRRALAEAGIGVSWSRGVGDPPKRISRKRRLIEVKGTPVSEQLIADRRQKATSKVTVYFLDASAAVKVYVRERGSDRVEKILDRGED